MNIILATTLFCRLLSPTAIAYAPDALVIDYPITNIEWHCEWPEGAAEPTKEWATTNITIGHKSVLAPEKPDYLAAGWLKNGVLPPSPKEGMVVASKTYKAQGGEVLAVYEYAPIPVPEPKPVRYSKKKFSLALAKRGIFSAFDSWASSTEVIEGSGLTVSRVLADSWYMSSDDEEFKAVRAVAEAKFGAEAIAAVLAESEDEEW